MKDFLVITFIALILAGCNDEETERSFEWKKLGLDGKIVNEMKLAGNYLFVATNDGLYRKDITTDQDFSLLGHEGNNVEAVVVYGVSKIVASTVDRSFAEPPALHITEDGGATWDVIENNFGGEYKEPIFDLAASGAILYGTGSQVVARSDDGGRTWNPIWAEWGGFGTGTDVIAVHTASDNELWAGGQGGIENGYLIRSKDEITWDEWHDLVENPTVVKAIVFDPNDADRVYAGYEAALIRTTNGGDDWETLIESEEVRFFFGIGVNPERGRIYAAGWLKRFDDPQPLKLFYSDNDGASWREAEYAGEDFGGVYDLQMIPGASEDRIFLGLYKGGVYEVIAR